MKLTTRILAALALACTFAASARADTVATMDGTWQLLGTSGATIDFQDRGPGSIQAVTAASAPASLTAPGQVIVKGDHRCWTLSTNLYVQGSVGTVVYAATGGTCPVGGGGSGGGGAASTVQANQGTAGSAPWLSALYQGGNVLSAANPLFTQLTAGSALIGSVNLSVGGAALLYGQATMAASLPVVIASNQSAIPVIGAFYQATQPVSASALPLPSGASQDGTDANSVTGPTGGVGIRGWLSGIYAAITGTLSTQPVDEALPSGFPAAVSATGQVGSVIDMKGYGSLDIEIKGSFVANIAFRTSDDPTFATYNNHYGTLENGGGLSTDYSLASQSGDFHFKHLSRYVQVYATAYTSGSPIVTARLSAYPYVNRTVYANQGTATPTATWGFTANGAATSGGVTLASRIVSSAASTNLTQAKSSAGRIYKIYACNTTTSARFLKVYNALSANVTVGTTAVAFSRQIPGSGCSSFDWTDVGFYLSTGISYAITAGNADSDATAVAAGDVTQTSVEFQ